MRLFFSPDEPQSTGDPATDENIDSGQPDSPPSRSDNRDMYVAKGIQIGIERALKKLGFSDIDSAKEELGSLRNGVVSNGNDSDPDEKKSQEESGYQVKLREMAKENHLFKRKLDDRDREIKRLVAQSDEARLMKLRAMALENGVGKGRQLDAFVKLYGDEVAFDDDRELVVLTRLSDGSREPMGESVTDFIKKALEQDPYLRPYDNSKGSGSRVKPAGGTSNPAGDTSPLAQEVFGSRSSSGRSRIFGERRKQNDGSS